MPTPVKVGDVMVGHTVSQVVESRNPDFTTGDFVTGYDGWQALRRLERQGTAEARSEGGADLHGDRRASACRA